MEKRRAPTRRWVAPFFFVALRRSARRVFCLPWLLFLPISPLSRPPSAGVSRRPLACLPFSSVGFVPPSLCTVTSHRRVHACCTIRVALPLDVPFRYRIASLAGARSLLWRSSTLAHRDRLSLCCVSYGFVCVCVCVCDCWALTCVCLYLPAFLSFLCF